MKNISAKKLKKLGGKVPFSTVTSPKKAIRKRPRKKSETLRIYGPPARREFVKSLPCAACGVVGYSENAHIENGGMGRKADYDKIAPLCGNRVEHNETSSLYTFGCHYLIHQLGGRSFVAAVAERLGRALDLDKAAAQTEKLWASSVLEDTKT